MLQTIALLVPILAPRLGFFRTIMKFFGPCKYKGKDVS